MTCDQSFKVTGSKVARIPATDVKNSSTKGLPDIAGATKRSQTFLAERSGILKTVYLPVYKTGNADADLQVAIYRADVHGNPEGNALANKSIPAKVIGWSVKRLAVHPGINLTKGAAYCIVLYSATSAGSYGFTYDNSKTSNPQLSFGKLQGDAFVAENGKQLNFKLIVTQ